ncbi:MAG: AAA family ATPase [Desulfobacteraceae bacterium]|nr:AAA family ATPase [Desulfobacteraceae bacterium]
MKNTETILYIFSGLPGSGKTTLSQMLARHLNAVYLRIDTVEQGLRDLCSMQVEAEGYRLSYKIASDNLGLGISVVADSCNPIVLSRTEWEQVAIESRVGFINIEIICSDKVEHQKRVETRKGTIPGLIVPTWKKVESRQYDTWTSKRVIIDTAVKTINESFNELVSKIERYGG